MEWRTLWMLLAITPSVAHASQVTKADRALAAFEAGDRAAIDTANRAADAAVVSNRYGADPAAWVIRGRVYYTRLVHPDVGGSIDPAIAAIESFEKAVALGAAGAAHAQLSDLVPALEGHVQSALVNDVEARAWPSAEGRLATALRARLLDERLRGSDPSREAPLRKLAVQITAELGKASEARTHYEAYAETSGTDDTPLACLVARAMADHGDVEGAITFIGNLSSRYPGDEVLLRTEVELLTVSGRTEEALARVDRALPVLQDSVSGAFLAARLYEAAGAVERARSMWQRVIVLDPRHVDSRIALGRSLTVLAVSRRGELRARAEELEERRPSREILDLVAALKDVWVQAETQLVTARQIAPSSREAVDAMVALYEAKIAGLDPETTERAEILVLEADQQKLDAARATLATFGAE